MQVSDIYHSSSFTYTILPHHLVLTFLYRARARTNPPNKAKLPEAMLATAALVVAAAGLVVVVADPVFDEEVLLTVAVGEM